MTSRFDYVGDDEEEDRDEMRYRAFLLWLKNGDRCGTRTLRLALEYAHDSRDDASQRGISAAISRKRR